MPGSQALRILTAPMAVPEGPAGLLAMAALRPPAPAEPEARAEKADSAEPQGSQLLAGMAVSGATLLSMAMPPHKSSAVMAVTAALRADPAEQQGWRQRSAVEVLPTVRLGRTANDA